MNNQPGATLLPELPWFKHGELYNTQALRDELIQQGLTFRGNSDTEVLLEACELWGVEVALKRTIGMFAFALWDFRDESLVIARDRLGIKPLYWSDSNNLFCFGSELKALKCHPDFDLTLNKDAIVSFLRHNYIPAPQSIYARTEKLKPGHFLVKKKNQDPLIHQYWDAQSFARDTEVPTDISDEQFLAQFSELLEDAVKRRMVADVPLGAFLSGGIDSSLIVSMMQSVSSIPVKTFSIGFEEQEYNEAQHAENVAKHLGTDHTSMYVTEAMALDTIPLLPQIFDEPFSDSSQIPTYLLSKLTRENVTVALSGDGGDELFAGYPRYRQTEEYSKILLKQPGLLRNLEAQVIGKFSPEFWNGVTKFAPSKIRTALSGDKLIRLPKVLKSGDPMMLYRSIVSHADHPELSKMQLVDIQTYLPDDILTKVDRTSMSVALEARVPLIDHRIVEFAATLPRSCKVRGKDTKWLLKQALYQHVPRELIDRPKMGFGVPLGKWLTNDLRDWTEDLLSEKELQRHGILNVETIRKKWDQHKSGKVNWQYHIWDAVVLQQWLSENSHVH